MEVQHLKINIVRLKVLFGRRAVNNEYYISTVFCKYY